MIFESTFFIIAIALAFGCTKSLSIFSFAKVAFESGK